MARNDFCVFILSYNRPKSLLKDTINTLINKGNYSGDWYIILGNDDPSIEEYKDLYGSNKVIIFDKETEMKITDTCDNFHNKKVVVYARNICFKIAEQLGYTYFLQLDDDYKRFEYRFPAENKLKTIEIEEFDKIVDIMIDWLEESNATTVAFGQGGDFIGGKDSSLAKSKIKRKAMNSFFCKTENPFQFLGSINEDTNAYCVYGSRGKLFMTICNIGLVQRPTQSNTGGLTDIYMENGTYLKSFYSVINCPSFVKIFSMDASHTRLHHRVDWNAAVPKIISDKYKK